MKLTRPTAAEAFRAAAIWALLSGLLLWFSWHTATTSARSGFSSLLDQQLLPAIIADGGYRIAQYDQDESLLTRINHDLQHLSVSGSLPVISSCSLHLSNLHGQEQQPAFTPDQRISLTRNTSEGAQDFLFYLRCDPDYPLWIGSQLTLAALATLLLSLLPAPLSSLQRHWYRLLQSRGMTAAQARPLAGRIAALPAPARHTLALILQQRPQADSAEAVRLSAALSRQPDPAWLQQALARNDCSLATALDIACAADSLSFIPGQQTVVIHGLPLQLPQTPYLYYLWYALRRSRGENDGWFINPPTNRPDRDTGAEISQLMAALGGHGKAINDLNSAGLKAKTLDQNRSKLKDELTSALGDELARHYLFETERDMTSGRTRYRLATPAAQINIPAESLGAIPNESEKHH